MALGTRQHRGLWEAMGGTGGIGDNRNRGHRGDIRHQQHWGGNRDGDVGAGGGDLARTGMGDIEDTSMGKGREGTVGQGKGAQGTVGGH